MTSGFSRRLALVLTRTPVLFLFFFFFSALVSCPCVATRAFRPRVFLYCRLPAWIKTLPSAKFVRGAGRARTGYCSGVVRRIVGPARNHIRLVEKRKILFFWLPEKVPSWRAPFPPFWDRAP